MRWSAFLLLNLWHYHPSESKNTSEKDYLARYFANRTLEGERGYLSKEYLNFTEDFIPPTIWQKSRPKQLLEPVSFASSSGQINFEENGFGYRISYQTPVEEKIIVAKTFFPGWEAQGDSGKLDIEPYSEYGIIAIPVSAGSGSFLLLFNNTSIRLLANTISAVSAAVILVLLIYPALRRFK